MALYAIEFTASYLLFISGVLKYVPFSGPPRSVYWVLSPPTQLAHPLKWG